MPSGDIATQSVFSGVEPSPKAARSSMAGPRRDEKSAFQISVRKSLVVTVTMLPSALAQIVWRSAEKGGDSFISPPARATPTRRPASTVSTSPEGCSSRVTASV